MDEKKLREQVHYAIDTHSPAYSPDPYRVQRVLHASKSGGRVIVKNKLSVGFVLLLVFMLMSLTALAVALLTGMDFVEQEAVPMAQQNDSAGYVQESFTHEELVQLIQTLNENGITLEEDGRIMAALRNGQGYWEEEVIMAICREAFGGLHYAWTIEQKHWFDEMMLQIGFKERNNYAIPGEGDMTIPEAKTHAAQLLYDEYGVTLPVESNEQWKLWEWFYALWNDYEGHHNAMWKFEYVNPASGETEYWVSFDQQGTLLESEMAWFLKEDAKARSYSHAEEMMDMKYGDPASWTVEAWAEFGELIAELEPVEVWEKRYAEAGYRMPPEGSIPALKALGIAQEAVSLEGQTRSQVICCTSNGRAIYKVTLRIHFPGNEASATYDAIWCVELDCMTGVVLEMRQYDYGNSESMMMYVPFTVLDANPKVAITPTAEEAAKIAEKERQADAYDAHTQQYADTWFFWPLEAQKNALGGHHHVPEGDEMTREEAVEMALRAIEEKHGKEALEQLGDYQVGAICCRYEETEGVRISWLLYITSDPELMSNGFRVAFDDPNGLMELTEVEVQRANTGNG